MTNRFIFSKKITIILLCRILFGQIILSENEVLELKLIQMPLTWVLSQNYTEYINILISWCKDNYLLLIQAWIRIKRKKMSG